MIQHHNCVDHTHQESSLSPAPRGLCYVFVYGLKCHPFQMAIHATLSVWTARLGVHTHPVPSCSNLHKWWLNQTEWPGCQSLISLTEDWWPIYFFITFHYALGTLFFIIFSPTVLSVSFPLFFHIFFGFIALFFSKPVLFTTPVGIMICWIRLSLSEWYC